MNQLKAKGNWNIAIGKAKRAYGAVKEDPILSEEGEKDERVGWEQKRKARARKNISQ